MSRPTRTWRELIDEEAQNHGEAIIACTLSDKELDVPFYDGFGSSEGASFTAWSASRVFFPVVYDGAEWVASVPRNPCSEATTHVGGE